MALPSRVHLQAPGERLGSTKRLLLLVFLHSLQGHQQPPALCWTSGDRQRKSEGMAVSFSAMTANQLKSFSKIQDIIGPSSQWPRQIQNWFHNGIPAGYGTSCKRRPLFAAFFWVNGLNPEVLYDWCLLKPNSHPGDAVTHYKWLFEAFARGDLQYLYSWNVSQGRYEYLNGRICNRRQ